MTIFFLTLGAICDIQCFVMSAFVKLISFFLFFMHTQIYASEVSYVFSFAESERWDAQQEKWVSTPKKQQFTVTVQNVKKRVSKKKNKTKYTCKGLCHFVNEDLFVNDTEIPVGESLQYYVNMRKKSSKGLEFDLLYDSDDMEGFADMVISIQYTNEKKNEGLACITIYHYGKPKYRNVKVKITKD